MRGDGYFFAVFLSRISSQYDLNTWLDADVLFYKTTNGDFC